MKVGEYNNLVGFQIINKENCSKWCLHGKKILNTHSNVQIDRQKGRKTQ